MYRAGILQKSLYPPSNCIRTLNILYKEVCFKMIGILICFVNAERLLKQPTQCLACSG